MGAHPRMQYCGGGYFGTRNTGDLTRLVAKLSSNLDCREILHRPALANGDLLWRSINPLPPLFLPRMTCHANFILPGRNRLRQRCVLCYCGDLPTREARTVDLTLRLNVLAVCAVFVFVGAILLGAF
jgi:hypothetical protein